jgi:hypothetical protein
LSSNQIKKVEDISAISVSVSNINLEENPISEELADNLKKELWMKYRNYQIVNNV